MVLSSLAPLFLLWAIKGSTVLPDRILVTGCLAMAVVPTALLKTRIWIAKKRNDTRLLVVGTSEDHRNHVLTYLFATMLPFYRDELMGLRDLAATAVALLFIVFLFWRLNLHYINVIFAFRGHRVFTVQSPDDANPLTGKDPFVVITRRHRLAPNDRLIAYRLSNSVYLEDSE